MRRLGVACGAQAETFAGLSGMGDLMVTCFSKLSRNRGFGERVGRGKARGHSGQYDFRGGGLPTARSAANLRKLKLSTPIIDEVHAMLYEGKNVRQAMQGPHHARVKGGRLIWNSAKSGNGQGQFLFLNA